MLPSCSDVLENYHKVFKNSVYHVSFLTIIGHEKEPISDPSYGQIYMKLLSFLSDPKYSSTVTALTKTHRKYFDNLYPDLIAVLNSKSLEESEEARNADNILIGLSRHGIPVLQ